MFPFGFDVYLMLIFFLCNYSFFCIVARRFTSVVPVAVFVVVVLGLLFWFSCVYFYVISLCNVRFLLGRVNA